MRRLEPYPVAIIATVRLGERGNGDRVLAILLDERDRRRRLRLGPLSLAALYRIVEQELGRGLPRPLLVRVERASGGNPFYALEIARALHAGNSAARGQELPIPDDVRELVAERLRTLPRRTREALLRVSALSQPTISLVFAADLAPAEEAGVVRVGANDRIEFAHPLFTNAIYASASHERRRKLHGELATTANDIETRPRHLILASARHQPNHHAATLLPHPPHH